MPASMTTRAPASASRSFSIPARVLKAYYRQCDVIREAWDKVMTECRHAILLSRMICVACNAAPKLRELERLAKSTAIYRNGRCLFHGGCSTGPTSQAGKARAAMNGHCPKKKRTHEG
ncbi:HGGxSTG domain-containing protein [Methylomonas subterranea]|uniref:HGGxSTG domain-containing protein n=1 Tax=Methylomonas subterranea TaxID=2952225 RepID=UPI003531C50D